jgi:hypothetical protein
VHRLFLMNTGRLAIVCLLNTSPSMNCNTREGISLHRNGKGIH